MSKGPTLETERLLLRVPQAQDFDGYAAPLETESIEIWAQSREQWRARRATEA